MYKYVFYSSIIVFTHKYDLVFATSTPLTAGIPGIFAKIFRKKPNKSTISKDPNIKNLEELITDSLGLKVEIQTKDNVAGKVLINYLDNDQLENIKKRLIS